jgi:hypothetical protein
MESKQLTHEQFLTRIGALASKLEPLLFEYKQLLHSAQHQIFHSKYCGDVDFSAIDINAVTQYALSKIVEAAREDGKRTVQWEMRQALGIPHPN